MGRSGLGLSVLVLTVLVLAISPTASGAPSAVFTLNTTDDGTDTDPGNGLCESGPDDDCTLRAAIEESNALSGGDTIIMPSATYLLAFGDLDVVGDLSITGAGAATTVVDGGDLGRVFEIGAGTVDISGLTIQNGSESVGAGIRNDATLTVTNSTFSGNNAEIGGGIANFATLTVTNSTFSGNSRDIGGGISNYGLATVTNSTFSGNSGASGGAIFNDATLTVANSTFSGNSVSLSGGGIRNQATLTVTHSTFSGNSASSGGGVANTGTLTLQNTIVANSPSGGNCSGTITDGGGNLQHPGTDCGATIASADPLLDPTGLQDNGGPTKTIALQSGSPAIDAAVAANCPATDQRGVARPQGPGCDIGAYERQPPTAVLLGLLSATLTRRGVAVRWHAESAAQTLGFNLYRQERGKLVRLNPALIPSVFGGTSSGHTYSFIDRRAPTGALRYRLQAVRLDGTRSWVGATSVRR